MWWSRTAIPRSVLRSPLVRRDAPPPCATPLRRLSRPLRRLLSRPRYARALYGSFRGNARLPAGWRRNPGRGVPGGAGCSLFLFIPGFQVVLRVRERAWTAENLGVVRLVFHALDDLRLFTGGGRFVRLFLELLYTVLSQVYLGVEPGLPGPGRRLQLGDVDTGRLERPPYDAHGGRPRHLCREVPDDLGGPLDGESVRRQVLRLFSPRHADLLGGVEGGPLVLGVPREHPGKEALPGRVAILVHLVDILSVAGRLSTRRVTSSSPWRKSAIRSLSRTRPGSCDPETILSSRANNSPRRLPSKLSALSSWALIMLMPPSTSW